MSLSEDELRVLLRDLESDRVERKESAADRDKLSQAVCAFANDMPGHGLPGVLFVGVTDGGRVVGDSVSDEQLRVLADLRDQGSILPPPTMAVRKIAVDDGEIAVVEAQPSMTPRCVTRGGCTSESARGARLPPPTRSGGSASDGAHSICRSTRVQ